MMINLRHVILGLLYTALLSAPTYGQGNFSTVNSYEPKGHIATTSILDLQKRRDRFTGGDSVAWARQGPWGLNNGEKFFASGPWNIPGYELKRGEDTDSTNIATFKAATDLFNLIHMSQKHLQSSYMDAFKEDTSGTAFLSGNSLFKWRFQSKRLKGIMI